MGNFLATVPWEHVLSVVTGALVQYLYMRSGGKPLGPVSPVQPPPAPVNPAPAPVPPVNPPVPTPQPVDVGRLIDLLRELLRARPFQDKPQEEKKP